MKITYTTHLLFTQTKNGHATGETFENTAGAYISAVRAASTNAQQFADLVSVTAYDADGDPETFHDAFGDLPIAEQLELCIEVDNDSHASRTTYDHPDKFCRVQQSKPTFSPVQEPRKYGNGI